MIPNPAAVKNPLGRNLLGVLLVFGPLYLLSSYGYSWAWYVALGILGTIILSRYKQPTPWKAP
jgi:hypothetical protein